MLPTLVERAVYPANALPGIVVALALVTISIRAVPWLYQTLPVLVVGYVILFLPRAVVGVRSTLELAPPALDEVATSLGCSRAGAARRVTLPLVLPGLAASMALVSLAVATELTATLLLSPIGTATLATEFWSRASAVEYGAAAPYALALIALSLPATWLLGRCRGGRTTRGGSRDRAAGHRAAKSFGPVRVLDGIDLDVPERDHRRPRRLRLRQDHAAAAGRRLPATRRRDHRSAVAGVTSRRRSAGAAARSRYRLRARRRARSSRTSTWPPTSAFGLPRGDRQAPAPRRRDARPGRAAAAPRRPLPARAVRRPAAAGRAGAGARARARRGAARRAVLLARRRAPRGDRPGGGGALRASEPTAVLVTHDQGEALSLADQVAVMARRPVHPGRAARRGLPRPGHAGGGVVRRSGGAGRGVRRAGIAVRARRGPGPRRARRGRCCSRSGPSRSR